MKKLVLLLLFVFIAASAAFAAPANGPDKMRSNVINVSNSKEFLLALGSDRTIVMAPGTYNLSKFDPFFSKTKKTAQLKEVNDKIAQNGVVWASGGLTDGGELRFKGIKNLTIEGHTAGATEVDIVIDPRSSFVFRFVECQNINLEGFKAGHTDDGECAGGVFRIENSSNVRLQGIRMYGCGTEGLNLFNVSDMQVVYSQIFSCTQAIMSMYNSRNISFDNCQFYDNVLPPSSYPVTDSSELITIYQSQNITFDSAFIERNYGIMFRLIESSDIKIRNTKFINNWDTMIDKKAEGISFTDCEFKS